MTELTEIIGIKPDNMLINTLAEISLRDEFIQTELKKKGYSQFEPPNMGFVTDTMPPFLSKEQSEEFTAEQNRKKLEHLASLPRNQQIEINKARESYNNSVEFMKKEVLASLDLLVNSKYGLKDIFIAILKGEEVDSNYILDTMRGNNIVVEEHPDKIDGFNVEANHGEVKYNKKENKWYAKFNSVALDDPEEIMHELIAIETIDPYLRNNINISQAAQDLPARLLVLLQGKSYLESKARARYHNQKTLLIPLLDKFFEIVGSSSKQGEFNRLFRNFLEPSE